MGMHSMLRSTRKPLLLAGWLLCGGAACAGSAFKEKGPDAAGGEAADGGSSSGDTSPIAGTSGSTFAPTTLKTRATDCGDARDASESYQVDLCVPAGPYTMGSTSPNLATGHFAHTPTHEVTLSAFLIDAYEVTVARYRSCVEASACDAPSTDADQGCTYTEEADSSEQLPVSCLTYTNATDFCSWDEGRRLPTEAEWERAAAGAEALLYPWGETFTCEHAVLASAGICSDDYTRPETVGSHPKGVSPVGAYDMSGNVAEWVSDYAAAYGSTAVTNPTGPASGLYRLTRGGAYKSTVTDGQTFVRVNALEATVDANGVRCVKPVSESD